MRNWIKRVFPCLILIFGFSVASSCVSVTSAHAVGVQNNLDKPVVVFAKEYYQGTWGEFHDRGQVAARTTKWVFSMVEPDSKSQDERYLVEARGLNGELIKSW